MKKYGKQYENVAKGLGLQSSRSDAAGEPRGVFVAVLEQAVYDVRGLQDRGFLDGLSRTEKRFKKPGLLLEFYNDARVLSLLSFFDGLYCQQLCDLAGINYVAMLDALRIPLAKHDEKFLYADDDQQDDLAEYLDVSNCVLN